MNLYSSKLHQKVKVIDKSDKFNYCVIFTTISLKISSIVILFLQIFSIQHNLWWLNNWERTKQSRLDENEIIQISLRQRQQQQQRNQKKKHQIKLQERVNQSVDYESLQNLEQIVLRNQKLGFSDKIEQIKNLQKFSTHYEVNFRLFNRAINTINCRRLFYFPQWLSPFSASSRLAKFFNFILFQNMLECFLWKMKNIQVNLDYFHCIYLHFRFYDMLRHPTYNQNYFFKFFLLHFLFKDSNQLSYYFFSLVSFSYEQCHRFCITSFKLIYFCIQSFLNPSYINHIKLILINKNQRQILLRILTQTKTYMYSANLTELIFKQHYEKNSKQSRKNYMIQKNKKMQSNISESRNVKIFIHVLNLAGIRIKIVFQIIKKFEAINVPQRNTLL